MNEVKKTSDKYYAEYDSHTRTFCIRDMDKNIVLDCQNQMYTPSFINDTVILQTYLRDLNDIVYRVVGLKNEKAKSFMVRCRGYRVLPNGNLIIDNLRDSGKSCIFDTRKGEIVSDNFSYIGDARYTSEGDICYLPSRIDICGDSTFFHFYGKLNMDGEFVSPIYNSATDEVLHLDREGFDFYEEIRKTDEYMKRKIKEKKDKINNLPFVSPCKMNK